LSVDGDELVMTSSPGPSSKNSSLSSIRSSLRRRSRKQSLDSAGEIDSLVEALSSDHMISTSPQESYHRRTRSSSPESTTMPGVFGVSDSSIPVRPIKVDGFAIDTPATPAAESQKTFPCVLDGPSSLGELPLPTPSLTGPSNLCIEDSSKLRVLIVEVMDLNLRPR
jgi:hypothetical protein